METIDFVLPWVDGNDPSWLKAKQIYQTNDIGISTAVDANSTCRYQDNGLLKYWFRGVEKFAPWVNKVFFITCGQKPSWLNIQHPKLRWIQHSDFIPSSYLPTFNANTIEMNLHRISELSNSFVYFNDDMLLLNDVDPNYFFVNSLPVLETDLRYSQKIGYNNWSRLVFNDYCIVNKSFNISSSIWSNRRKWFGIKELGYKRARRNLLCFIANRTLPVGLYGHNAIPHLKSTLQEIWDMHPSILNDSSKHKFRSDDQVNQWLMCAWNQAKGCFYPANEKSPNRLIGIKKENLAWISQTIKNQECHLVCLNENEHTTDNEFCYRIIAEAFEFILPEKSSYELE